MAVRRRQWTLRRRLVLGIVVLLAFVSIVIGTVSVLALQGSLVEKVDAQLSTAVQRAQRALDGQGDFPGSGNGAGAPSVSDVLRFSQLPPGTVLAALDDTTKTGAVLGQGLQSVDQLTESQADQLLAVSVSQQPVTVDLGGTLGQYRVLTTQSSDGVSLSIGSPLADTNTSVNQVLIVVVLVTLAGLALAFFAGSAIVEVALRPLERVTATAAHVAELPLERGDVAIETRVPEEDADPRTEVGQVGAAINRMLGHIANALSARESSEQKLRSFVADASHELRTPLASIRGYAELTRRSGHELPDDVVHSLGRVESEAIRMTSLVEDLLLLARLDDGRELESNPVDLSRILENTVGDAYAAGQDHEWALEIPDEPIVLPGDAARLHQVMVNLLANARVHTPAGTSVVASAERVGDTVEIRVTDDGPGIPDSVLPTVFERFVRGDSSRSRVAGSTGLGLAIVAAVVDAHGGAVGVESEPGRTVFTVTLPA
jgi:two-component system OmpR family sensor kinase